MHNQCFCLKGSFMLLNFAVSLRSQFSCDPALALSFYMCFCLQHLCLPTQIASFLTAQTDFALPQIRYESHMKVAMVRTENA